MTSTIRSIIEASIQTKQRVLADETLLSNIERAADQLVTAFRNGNKVLFCGNGGSAADAQHLAAELSGRFYTDRDPLPAEALHVNTSYLTAVANDFGFDVVYSRLVKAFGQSQDVLIALSTSGNSPNILNAISAAKEKNMFCIGLTGDSGGMMKGSCDILLNIPSTDTPRIQESHIMIGHIICQLVEKNYFNPLTK
jgi:D-sedoheptulose 7-phosphate isomerase